MTLEYFHDRICDELSGAEEYIKFAMEVRAMAIPRVAAQVSPVPAGTALPTVVATAVNPHLQSKRRQGYLVALENRLRPRPRKTSACLLLVGEFAIPSLAKVPLSECVAQGRI